MAVGRALRFLREGLLRAWEKVGSEPKDMYAYSLKPTDKRAP